MNESVSQSVTESVTASVSGGGLTPCRQLQEAIFTVRARPHRQTIVKLIMIKACRSTAHKSKMTATLTHKKRFSKEGTW